MFRVVVSAAGSLSTTYSWIRRRAEERKRRRAARRKESELDLERAEGDRHEEDADKKGSTKKPRPGEKRSR